jgi:hypothetical protein
VSHDANVASAALTEFPSSMRTTVPAGGLQLIAKSGGRRRTIEGYAGCRLQTELTALLV